MGSDNGLALPRRWDIIWTNDGIVYWHIYASLGLSELKVNTCIFLIHKFSFIYHCVQYKLKYILSQRTHLYMCIFDMLCFTHCNDKTCTKHLCIHFAPFHLTHWVQVTHICISELAIVRSDSGLSSGRRQTIIWTNAGILLIVPLLVP